MPWRHWKIIFFLAQWWCLVLLKEFLSNFIKSPHGLFFPIFLNCLQSYACCSHLKKMNKTELRSSAQKRGARLAMGRTLVTCWAEDGLHRTWEIKKQLSLSSPHFPGSFAFCKIIFMFVLPRIFFFFGRVWKETASIFIHVGVSWCELQYHYLSCSCSDEMSPHVCDGLGCVYMWPVEIYEAFVCGVLSVGHWKSKHHAWEPP